MRAATLLVGAAVVSLTVAGCTATPTPVPVETPHSGPPVRTHWELRHRILDTKGLRVVGQQLDDGGESTTVRLTDPATKVADDCYVSFSVPGQGGPDNRVGEQIPRPSGGPQRGGRRGGLPDVAAGGRLLGRGAL